MIKQKEEFVFNKVNLKEAEEIIAKYPENRQKSAMLPLLDLAQRQNGGWLSVAAMEYVANYIAEPFMRVYEVATFYTMYNLKPVGKYHIQVCGTTPCWLRGAEDIMKACEKHAQTKCGETSDDGLFTISEVECLGACVDAPVVQINDDYHENLDPKKVQELIENFKKEKA
ncbi:MAG: NADH-quinone oxidoreductase subunit NuoE [Rickettsiaceae bacterium]|nr:NADH-quinone oxidoreductase subunit NuoE [Rickettsiaceae bacterium]MDP5083449.1 NADH-quinone oxidoreductase subunit NuoE [Rickettsiaceae bacterium]